MGWFESRDGTKSKISVTETGGQKYERISKPKEGGRHDHSITKSDPSGEVKHLYYGDNNPRKDKDTRRNA